jgi:hypothetical protein
MLCRKIVAVYCEKNTENVKTVCGAEFLVLNMAVRTQTTRLGRFDCLNNVW